MKQLFGSPFPFYFDTDRENLLLTAGTAVFAVLFIEVFHPFDIAEELDHPKAIYGLITFLVLGTAAIIVPRIRPQWFENWNLLKFIGYNLCCVIGIAFLVSLYHYFISYRDLDVIFFQMWAVDLFHTFLIAILPLFLMFFIISNRALQYNLEQARQANERLSNYRQLGGEQSTQHAEIQADTQERLSIDLSQLLYAEAEDNYSRIVWQNNGHIQEHLLRVTLGRLEDQIVTDHIVRCHRSFIVNLDKLSAVEGNASGYRLHLEGIDQVVPVSRTRSHQLADWFDSFTMKTNGSDLEFS